MLYLVRISDRAHRDMEAIYEFIHADVSEKAFAWFHELADAILSLETFPERGAPSPERKKLRHLLFLFGKKHGTYRIIYAVDKRNHTVDVLHIRHTARQPKPNS